MLVKATRDSEIGSCFVGQEICSLLSDSTNKRRHYDCARVFAISRGEKRENTKKYHKNANELLSLAIIIF